MTRACPSCVLVRCVAAKGQAQARGPRQETEYRETERVSSLCPRSSRDWQPLTTAREKRERDGTAIERPPLRFARGIGSSKKEPGGPDRRARRRAPSYQTFEPTSSSLSPFLSPPLSSTPLPRRRDLETSRRRSSNSDFAARLFLPLRGGSSVARYRCRPPSNAFPFLPSAPVNWSPGVYKTPSRLRALGGPPCAAARIESRTK